MFPFSLFLGRSSWASDGVWGAGFQKKGHVPWKFGSHFAFHLYSEGKSAWHGVFGFCTLLQQTRRQLVIGRPEVSNHTPLRDVTCVFLKLTCSRLLPSHDVPYNRVHAFGLCSLELVFEVPPTAGPDNGSSIQPNSCAEKPETHCPKP